AKSPLFRPIKYSLFPPLGLATLAAHLRDTDEVTLQDEHVEPLDLTDEPDLVVIQVYITAAYRAYAIADHYRRKGAHVALGCLHTCVFCYKVAFFRGGRSFYTQQVDRALAEIDRLPGKHLYFLDDHLFGNPRFARELFAGMRGMGRVWQAAGTVQSVLQPGL